MRDDWPEPPDQEGGAAVDPLDGKPVRRPGGSNRETRWRRAASVSRTSTTATATIPGRSWAAAFRRVEKEIVREGEGVDEVSRE